MAIMAIRISREFIIKVVRVIQGRIIRVVRVIVCIIRYPLLNRTYIDIYIYMSGL